MNKILSIIVPTYNMERYLRRCLDSLIVSDENMQRIEVLVINDGSRDSSSQIAHEYETKFPQTFRVIDKENGNYGSCINRGLKEMSGKYVKVLDSDDYFDNSNLSLLLPKLSVSNSDMILTDMNCIYQGRQIVSHSYPYKKNIVLDSNILNDKFFKDRINMHSITYKSEIFNSLNYKQTEGISYTDQEWIYYPMVEVNTIEYFPFQIYQYVLDREGQTMNLDVEINRVDHKIIIMKRMIDYLKLTTFDNQSKENYIKTRTEKLLRLIYKFVLLYQSNEQYLSHKAELEELDKIIEENLIWLYEDSYGFLIASELPLRFVRYWRVKGKRYPFIVLKLHKLMKNFDVYLRKSNLRK